MWVCIAGQGSLKRGHVNKRGKINDTGKAQTKSLPKSSTLIGKMMKTGVGLTGEGACQ